MAEKSVKIEENVIKILKIAREIKDERVGRSEIIKIVRETIREEVGGLRQEMKKALMKFINDKNAET